jgi:hypothetical protein
MIARIWKGAIRHEDADASYMQTTGIAGYPHARQPDALRACSRIGHGLAGRRALSSLALDAASLVIGTDAAASVS